MIIGIDGNEANTTNKVGVGQYAFQLICELSKIDTQNKYIIYLKTPPNSDLPPTSKNWRYQVFGPQKLWTRIALPLHLFTQKTHLDIFFSLSHYSPLFCPYPTIPTIHDLGYLQYQDQFTKKDLYQLKNWTYQAIKKAKHIITVSQFSKDEIVKTYSVDPLKITIAYNGVQTPPKINLKIQQKIISAYNLQPNNYYLCLGTLKPNKNIPFLIKSFSLLLKQLKQTNSPFKEGKDCPPKLVIAGKKGWLFNEIFNTVKKERVEKSVVFTDFVTENQKWTLYQQAIASILPSTYEGFGIPAIESMKVGTPVIVSSIPPFKEVVQDSGLFIDPQDESDLCHKMIDISYNQTRNKYSKLGIQQANKFSWNSTAKSVLEVFKKLMVK